MQGNEKPGRNPTGISKFVLLPPPPIYIDFAAGDQSRRTDSRVHYVATSVIVFCFLSRDSFTAFEPCTHAF
jgi:hypothetical protein